MPAPEVVSKEEDHTLTGEVAPKNDLSIVTAEAVHIMLDTNLDGFVSMLYEAGFDEVAENIGFWLNNDKPLEELADEVAKSINKHLAGISTLLSSLS